MSVSFNSDRPSFVLRPPARQDQDVKNRVIIPCEIVDLIFSYCAASIPSIRRTCSAWNQWFESKALQYAPALEDPTNRFELVTLTTRILRIQGVCFRSYIHEKGKLSECVFDRTSKGKAEGFYYTASVNDGKNFGSFVSNNSEVLNKPLTNQICASSKLNEHRYWFMSLMGFGKALKVKDQILVTQKHINISPPSSITLMKADKSFLLCKREDERLFYFNFETDEKMKEIKFPKSVKVCFIEIFNSRIYLALDDGSVGSQTIGKRIQKSTILPPHPTDRVTSMKTNQGKLYIGKSEGTLCIHEEGKELVTLPQVHEKEIDGLAVDGPIIFSASTVTIKCHTYVSGKLNLIARFIDTSPGNIFYGEGIFLKGRVTGGFVAYDYNFKNPVNPSSKPKEKAQENRGTKRYAGLHLFASNVRQKKDDASHQ